MNKVYDYSGNSKSPASNLVKNIASAKKNIADTVKDYVEGYNDIQANADNPNMAKLGDAEKAYADAKNTLSPTFEYGDINENERYQNALSDLENIKSSAPTRSEFGSLEDYKAYKSAKEAYDNAKANRPGEYKSKFENQINSLVDQIINRQKFNYNYRTDDKYAAYRKSSEEAARKAANNSMAMSARMSGGYGNSYAQNAAAQAYAEQMAGVTDKIPEFEQLAYERDRAERSDLNNNLSILDSLDSKEYARYRNDVNDYYTNLGLLGTDVDRANNQFYADRNYHTQYEDSLMNDYNTRLAYAMQALANAENRYNADRDFAINKWRYDVSDRNANLDMLYNDMLYADNRAQQALENRRYNIEYLDRKMQQALENKRYDTEYADKRADIMRNWQYQTERDKIDDVLRQQQFQETLKQQAFENDLATKNYNLSKREQDFNEWYKKYVLANPNTSSSSSSRSRRSSSGSSGSSGSSSGYSSSYASGGADSASSNVMYSTSGGNVSEKDIYNAAVKFVNEHPNTYLDDSSIDSWSKIKRHSGSDTRNIGDFHTDSNGNIIPSSDGYYASGLSVPLDGEAGLKFRAYLQKLGLRARDPDYGDSRR